MRPCPSSLTVLHLLRAMCQGSTPSLVAACCQLLTSTQTLQVRLQAIASEFTSLSSSYLFAERIPRMKTPIAFLPPVH